MLYLSDRRLKYVPPFFPTVRTFTLMPNFCSSLARFSACTGSFLLACKRCSRECGSGAAGDQQR